MDPNAEFIGEVMTRCNAQEVVQSCWDRTIALVKEVYGHQCVLPALKLQGHVDATFPYILSHLQYIVGELLRNSIQAIVEMQPVAERDVAPISVLICEAPQHVIIRISDRGGGIPADVMPSLCKSYSVPLFIALQY